LRTDGSQKNANTGDQGDSVVSSLALEQILSLNQLLLVLSKFPRVAAE
jgi:hypothetical protein